MDSYLCSRLNEKIRRLSNELHANEQVLGPSRRWEWTDTLTAEACLLQLDCLIAIIRDRSRFPNHESDSAPLQQEECCPGNNVTDQGEYLSMEQEENFTKQVEISVDQYYHSTYSNLDSAVYDTDETTKTMQILSTTSEKDSTNKITLSASEPDCVQMFTNNCSSINHCHKEHSNSKNFDSYSIDQHVNATEQNESEADSLSDLPQEAEVDETPSDTDQFKFRTGTFNG